MYNLMEIKGICLIGCHGELDMYNLMEIEGLLRIIWESIVTYSLSNLIQSIMEILLPQKGAPYIAIRLIKVSKSHAFIIEY